MQELGVICDQRRGYAVLSLYCTYWMINKTAYDLEYRVCHLPSCTPFVLLLQSVASLARGVPQVTPSRG